MKKLMAVVLASACIMGMAAPAMAKTPVVEADTIIELVKKNDDADFWYADFATSLLCIRNLKWDAKIVDTQVNGIKQLKVDKKAYGAYYLNLCVNKYAYPGKTGSINLIVKQDDKYYELKTDVRFIQGITPFKYFTISGELDYAEGTYVNYDVADKFAGYREAELKYAKSVDLAKIDIKMNDGQKLKEIYGCFKNGCERKLTNGNQYKLSELNSITVEFETTKDYAPAYFKKETGSYTGTKRYPVKKCVTLNIKAK